MAIFVQAIGALGGAFAGLLLGTMFKFTIGGVAVDLRYGFLLLGILIGYGVARLITRPPKQSEDNA